jgi:hypothetical protein
MASYIAAGNGNFNTGATWKLVSANSLLDSEAGNTVVATAPAWGTSATFVPGAVEVDGVAVKLYARTGTTGTFTIELYNSTDATTEGTCTVNCADFCSADGTNNGGGWVLFTFAAHTLDAADNHVVRCQTTSASQITLWRNGTASNWSRMVRTTTAADSPPAAASILHIMEEKTGAGAATTRTVTMDAIAAAILKYGSGTDASACLTISDGGTLNYGFTAATAYYLQLDGNLIVYNQGTLTTGTVGSEIPRDGSAILEFDPTADGGMGLICRNGSAFTAQGLSRTVAKNIYYCKLNTDEAVNSTSLGVDTDTGWLDNDKIAVASTTQTYSQCETGLLNGAAAAAVLTVDGFGGAGGGLAYAHSGISPTQAEVILLTRNVKVRSTSATVMAYVNLKATSIVDIDWVEFYYLGENAATKYGITMETTTGSCSIQYSSMWNCEDGGFYITGTATNNITVSYNVGYNLWSAVANGMIAVATATTGTPVISNNIMMLAATTGSYGIYLLDIGGTVTNNTVCGIYGSGIYLLENSKTLGTFSGNTSHSNSAAGINWQCQYPSANASFSNLTVWRNNAAGTHGGIYIYYSIAFSIWSNIICFGNNISNIYTINSPDISNATFTGLDLDGDTTFATTTGFQIAGTARKVTFYNCNFGVAAGIKTTHTNDIVLSTFDYSVLFQNCVFGSGTEVSGQSDMLYGYSYLKSAGHDGVGANHKTWFKYGTISTDTTAGLFRTASPSIRCTPNNASNKLESGSFKVNVNSGETCTPTVYVRESVVGDGTDYNGSRIRLILKRNDAIGITADAVNDTATVASEGAFEAIGEVTAAATADGVMEFVVDCDETTGWINVDDFTATVA